MRRSPHRVLEGRERSPFAWRRHAAGRERSLAHLLAEEEHLEFVDERASKGSGEIPQSEGVEERGERRLQPWSERDAGDEILMDEDTSDAPILPPWVYEAPEQCFENALELFRGGPPGVDENLRRRNLPAAFDLFGRLAVESNHVGAMKWFSRCLRSGWGCDMDMAAGTEWCRRAADAGDVFCKGLCFR